MRCEFCGKHVVGSPDPVTVAGRGPAHYGCLTAMNYQQRQFKSLCISTLSDDDLHLLNEFVLTERNHRERQHAPVDNSIEFF